MLEGNKKSVRAAAPKCGIERFLVGVVLSEARSVMYVSQADRPSPRPALQRLLYTREADEKDSIDVSKARGSKLQVIRSPRRKEPGL